MSGWATAVVAVAASLAGGGLVAALLTHKRETEANLVRSLSARLTEVETWRATQETRYTALWSYTRKVVDYAYRYRREDAPPIPDMPDELMT